MAGTAVICAPLLEKFLKFRHSDEEYLQKSCKTAMQVAGNHAPGVVANLLSSLIEWYMEEPSAELMRMYCL